MLRNIIPRAFFPTFLKVSVNSFMEGCGVKLPTHILLGLSMGYHDFLESGLPSLRLSNQDSKKSWYSDIPMTIPLKCELIVKTPRSEI